MSVGVGEWGGGASGGKGGFTPRREIQRSAPEQQRQQVFKMEKLTFQSEPTNLQPRLSPEAL